MSDTRLCNIAVIYAEDGILRHVGRVLTREALDDLIEEANSRHDGSSPQVLITYVEGGVMQVETVCLSEDDRAAVLARASVSMAAVVA